MFKVFISLFFICFSLSAFADEEIHNYLVENNFRSKPRIVSIVDRCSQRDWESFLEVYNVQEEDKEYFLSQEFSQLVQKHKLFEKAFDKEKCHWFLEYFLEWDNQIVLSHLLENKKISLLEDIWKYFYEEEIQVLVSQNKIYVLPKRELKKSAVAVNTAKPTSSNTKNNSAVATNTAKPTSSNTKNNSAVATNTAKPKPAVAANTNSETNTSSNTNTAAVTVVQPVAEQFQPTSFSFFNGIGFTTLELKKKWEMSISGSHQRINHNLTDHKTYSGHLQGTYAFDEKNLVSGSFYIYSRKSKSGSSYRRKTAALSFHRKECMFGKINCSVNASLEKAQKIKKINAYSLLGWNEENLFSRNIGFSINAGGGWNKYKDSTGSEDSFVVVTNSQIYWIPSFLKGTRLSVEGNYENGKVGKERGYAFKIKQKLTDNLSFEIRRDYDKKDLKLQTDSQRKIDIFEFQIKF